MSMECYSWNTQPCPGLVYPLFWVAFGHQIRCLVPGSQGNFSVVHFSNQIKKKRKDERVEGHRFMTYAIYKGGRWYRLAGHIKRLTLTDIVTMSPQWQSQRQPRQGFQVILFIPRPKDTSCLLTTTFYVYFLLARHFSSKEIVHGFCVQHITFN